MDRRTKLIQKILKNNWRHPSRVLNAALSFLLPLGAKVWAGPVSVDIEPTIACNLSCVMCHRRELAERRKSLTMDLITFKKIIDQLPTVLKLNLQGMGEPTLAADFFQMVRYAKSKEIAVTTVTNGNLLSAAKIQAAVASGLDRIYFSIDTQNSEQYRHYRPGGELAIVKRNLEQLVKERNQQKSDLEIGIWMLLFNDNTDQLIPMLEFAKRIGVDEVIVNTSVSDRGKENWKATIAGMKAKNNEHVTEAIAQAKIEAKKLGVRLFFVSGVGSMKPTAGARCQWPWRALYVTTEGDVSPCCIVADPQVANLGNMLSTKFKNIWQGQAYQDLRQRTLRGNVPDYCKGCYRKG